MSAINAYAYKQIGGWNLLTGNYVTAITSTETFHKDLYGIGRHSEHGEEKQNYIIIG